MRAADDFAVIRDPKTVNEMKVRIDQRTGSGWRSASPDPEGSPAR